MLLTSKNGSFEVVKLLIGRGTRVNYEDNNRSIPLQLASDDGSFEVVKLLIQNGATK